MIRSAAVMGLHIDRGFVGLDVISGQSLIAHGAGHRDQHVTYPHDPAAHRRTADLDTGVALQNRTLSIGRAVVPIFSDDRIDDDAVRYQALVDDARGKRRRNYAQLLAFFAGTLLALRYLDEVLSGLHIEHFTGFITDHCPLGSAAGAYALRRRA